MNPTYSEEFVRIFNNSSCQYIVVDDKCSKRMQAHGINAKIIRSFKCCQGDKEHLYDFYLFKRTEGSLIKKGNDKCDTLFKDVPDLMEKEMHDLIEMNDKIVNEWTSKQGAKSTRHQLNQNKSNEVYDTNEQDNSKKKRKMVR